MVPMPDRARSRLLLSRLVVVLVLAAAGALGLFATSASAAVLHRPETRVAAFGLQTTARVGAHDAVLPGQRRARAPDSPTTASGSCVAAEGEGGASGLLGVSGPEGSGPNLSMNWDSINAVSEKFGIDLSGNEVKINSSIAGLRGSTAADGTITLYRGAFANEETLAKTPVHEQFHVAQLEGGMPYPEVYDPNSPFELGAEQHAQDWWASQS